MRSTLTVEELSDQLKVQSLLIEGQMAQLAWLRKWRRKALDAITAPDLVPSERALLNSIFGELIAENYQPRDFFDLMDTAILFCFLRTDEGAHLHLGKSANGTDWRFYNNCDAIKDENDQPYNFPDPFAALAFFKAHPKLFNLGGSENSSSEAIDKPQK